MLQVATSLPVQGSSVIVPGAAAVASAAHLGAIPPQSVPSVITESRVDFRLKSQRQALEAAAPDEAPAPQAFARSGTISSLFSRASSPFFAQLLAQGGQADVSADAAYSFEGTSGQVTAFRPLDPQTVRRDLLYFNAPPYEEAPKQQAPQAQAPEGDDEEETPPSANAAKASLAYLSSLSRNPTVAIFS